MAFYIRTSVSQGKLAKLHPWDKALYIYKSIFNKISSYICKIRNKKSKPVTAFKKMAGRMSLNIAVYRPETICIWHGLHK